MIRLDKLLSNRGYCSRKEVSKLLRAGAITVNGEIPAAPDVKVDPDQVLIDGEALDPGEGLLLMLNKPAGYTCSKREGGLLVYELLPERFLQRNPPISTVGRLDKDTTGLLLITDDGQLLHKLTSPRSMIRKVYEVEVEKPFSGREAELFKQGTMLLPEEETPLLPVEMEVLGERKALLTLVEGRYRQIRRMFETLDNHVVTLRRIKIGELTLGTLALGEYVFLSAKERALFLCNR